MNTYDQWCEKLRHKPATWLVTGVAGFIGSHLLETLLTLDQRVIGLDNFSTGRRANLAEVETRVAPAQWWKFTFVQGDVRDLDVCRSACAGVNYVLHQAALGSVPRSIEDPLRTHASNVDGFVNMLAAARDARVRHFVYASSSSVYGDNPDLPKCEDAIGRPLSPYALTKQINEQYAAVFARTYAFGGTGLRYFNVYGPRQDPAGPYAAVIPRWFASLARGEAVTINGDGETSRDFCYIANCVQANILAACTGEGTARARVFNVACGQRTTLNELYALIARRVGREGGGTPPVYADFRPGDVRHSLADIARAAEFLGYAPTHSIADGLDNTARWFIGTCRNDQRSDI